MLCLLSAFLLCLWCAMLEYGSISRFKGVFRGFYGVCVGLCCLGALRGLWGFCARVELGGLKACGVFAPRFILFAPMFPLLCLSFYLFTCFMSFCPSLVWLPFVSHCLFSCFPCGFLYSLFPFRTMRKKKGRKVFSLRPLFDCYPYSNVLYIFHSFTSVAFSSAKE